MLIMRRFYNMINILQIGIVLSLLECVIASNESDGRNSTFIIRESNVPYFDLTIGPNNSCINYKPYYNARNSAKSKIWIRPNQNSKCFIIYDERGCKGTYLEFANVVKDKDLIIDSIQESGEIKLLNFNVRVNSISSCTPFKYQNETWKGDTECGSNKGILLNAAPIENAWSTTEACSNIPDLDKVPTYEPQDERDFKSMSVLVDKDIKSDLRVCLETFSKPDCQGELVKFIVPKPNGISSATQLDIPMWSYYDKHVPADGNPVDTNVESIRNCHCSHPKPNLTTPDSDLLMTTRSMEAPKKPIVNNIGPSPIPGITPNKTNQTNKTKNCVFLDCMDLKSFLLSGNETGASCYLIFNQSDCSSQPSLRIKKLNKAELEKTVSCHKEISNWGITKCPEPDQEDSYCSTPSSSTTLVSYFACPLKTLKSSKKQEKSTHELIVPIITYSLAGILFIILLILVFMLYRKKKRIRELRNGLRHNVPMNRFQWSFGEGNGQPTQIEENEYETDVSGLTSLSRCFQTNGFEIPRESLLLGNGHDASAPVLGSGEFTTIYKGKLAPDGRTVAVKSLKPGLTSTRKIKGALQECKIFMECGKHERIKEFLGVCTEGMRRGEIYMVMEYCEKGSLKSFLLQRKHNFLNLVEDGEMKQDVDLKSHAETPIDPGQSLRFNTFQLFRWCWEISEAMEFLALRKIIHMSLNARNVMLMSDYSSKLCDFSFAKVPIEGSIMSSSTRAHTSNDKNMLWRWLAVETILHDICSTESDIWSFGVFMWELFSLGATPYVEHMYGGDFTMCLKHGYRLPRPELATLQIYELMLICWYDGPEKRPTFSKLKEKLYGMLSA